MGCGKCSNALPRGTIGSAWRERADGPMHRSIDTCTDNRETVVRGAHACQRTCVLLSVSVLVNVQSMYTRTGHV